MASLRIYSESDGERYVVIVSDNGYSFIDDLTEGDTLEVEINMPNEKLTSFPTNRILRPQ